MRVVWLQLYAGIRQRMEDMQQHNMSWIEVQFLKKAVDILCMCRQTLMYTYVFAYYLKKNNQSIIFEVRVPSSLFHHCSVFRLNLENVYFCQDNQRDLEQVTEQLSEYLERDITQDMLVDIKQKVQDKFRCAPLLYPPILSSNVACLESKL